MCCVLKQVVIKRQALIVVAAVIIMSVLNQSGEEQVECPLCMEPLEVDDLNFFPCTCGYQVNISLCIMNHVSLTVVDFFL
jgi:hypothetical protein